MKKVLVQAVSLGALDSAQQVISQHFLAGAGLGHVHGASGWGEKAGWDEKGGMRVRFDCFDGVHGLYGVQRGSQPDLSEIVR